MKGVLDVWGVFALGVAADVAYVWLALRDVPVWQLLPLVVCIGGVLVYLLRETRQ